MTAGIVFQRSVPRLLAPEQVRSATAADRHVVHANTAYAAGLGHGTHAVAASLDHCTASGVAAGAGDAYAVFGRLALAHAHSHIAAAHHHAIHHHAATAHAASHHRAEILKHRCRHRVVTDAGHFHAAGTLFHFDLTPGNHHPLRSRGSSGARAHGAGSSMAHPGHAHSRSLHHKCARHLCLPSSKVSDDKELEDTDIRFASSTGCPVLS
jgi:hypothetical protein